MKPADPQSIATVHVQQPAPPSGPLSAIALTVSQKFNRLPNVYYINQGKVFNAYQNDTIVTTGSPIWTVVDTHFRTQSLSLTLFEYSFADFPGQLTVFKQAYCERPLFQMGTGTS